MEQMNEINKAWLAGLIDGEGCFSLIKSGHQKKRIPMFKICNSDYELMRRVSHLLDVQIYRTPKGTKTQKNMSYKTDHYVIIFYRQKVIDLIQNIMSHLIGEKKKQAEKVINYYEREIKKYRSVRYNKSSGFKRRYFISEQMDNFLFT